MDQPFMARAIQLSIENVHSDRGGPFGAVIVKNGSIIAEGTNQVTSTHDPTAHAEVIAIREACRKLSVFQLYDCEIYTSCEPCPMCLGAIYWARPKRVVYANTRHDAAAIEFDDEFIYQEMNTDILKRQIPFVHQPHPLALQVFEDWKKIEN